MHDRKIDVPRWHFLVKFGRPACRPLASACTLFAAMTPGEFSTLATVNSTSMPAGMALLAVVMSITRVAKVADPPTLFGIVKAMVGVPASHPACVVAVTSEVE